MDVKEQVRRRERARVEPWGQSKLALRGTLCLDQALPFRLYQVQASAATPLVHTAALTQPELIV